MTATTKQHRGALMSLVAGAVLQAVVSLGAAWVLPASAAAETDSRKSPVLSRVEVPVNALGTARVAELSGLAWDADEGILYAISDRGYLFRFHLGVVDRQLRSVQAIDAVRLRWPAGLQPESAGVDAEGLATLRSDNGIEGDTELIVSTEGQPQVMRLSTQGQVLEQMSLPAPLSEARRFRADNTMLEALTLSPGHGLLTAAESPLSGEEPGFHEIHAHGKSWSFPMLDPDRSRLKAMESFADDTLVVLERSRAGKEKGPVTALRRMQLNTCGGKVVCKTEELLVIDQAAGAGNFEGMTYLGDMQFLLVSDNLGSKHTPSLFMLVDLKWRTRE